MLHHASWVCACCFLLAWPKVSIFKPAICIFPSCASSVRLLLFNRISHITASAPYICILHLSNPNYLLYELGEHPRNVVLYSTRRIVNVGYDGTQLKSHSALHCVSVYGYNVFFHPPTFHAECVCVILCIRSQRCTSWSRL